MRSPLRASYAAGLAVIFGLLLPAGPAAAECDKNDALFEDDFEFFDPTWGNPSDILNVENGVLVLKGNWTQVNLQTHNESANVCVDMTIVEAPDPYYSPIGLVWWWENLDNYYFMLYWADSPVVEIRRLIKGREQTLFSVETQALKQGLGETNHVELQSGPRTRPSSSTVPRLRASKANRRRAAPRLGSMLPRRRTSWASSPSTILSSALPNSLGCSFSLRLRREIIMPVLKGGKK